MKYIKQWLGLYGNEPTISGKINNNEPVSGTRDSQTTQRSRKLKQCLKLTILAVSLGLSANVLASTPAEGVWYRTSFAGGLQEKLTCVQNGNGGIACQSENINDPVNGTIGKFSLGPVKGNFAKQCLPKLNALANLDQSFPTGDFFICLSAISFFPTESTVSSDSFLNCISTFNNPTAISVVNSICTNPIAAYSGHGALGANGDLTGPSDFQLNPALISVMPNNILWLHFRSRTLNVVRSNPDEFTIRDDFPVKFTDGCFALMMHTQTACPWYSTPTDAAANVDSACYDKYDNIDAIRSNLCP